MQYSFLYWILYFIVSILIAWVAFSLIIMWFAPTFFNADGSVNWWTTLWVVALTLLFAWIITMILAFIIRLLSQPSGCAKPDPCAPACPKADPCPKPDPCDPCAKSQQQQSWWSW